MTVLSSGIARIASVGVTNFIFQAPHRSRNYCIFDSLTLLQELKGVGKLSKRICSADQLAGRNLSRHEQLVGAPHGLGSKVKRAQDSDLIVVQSIGVESRRGS